MDQNFIPHIWHSEAPKGMKGRSCTNQVHVTSQKKCRKINPRSAELCAQCEHLWSQNKGNLLQRTERRKRLLIFLFPKWNSQR